MTEKEYIITKDLAHITNAIACLVSIVPENSEIIDSRFKEIISTLYDWQEQHFKDIKIN